jgi:hypothetical protein
MSTSQLWIVGAVSFYLLVFVSGFWLSRSGKPYNSVILTLHKLIALAGAILLVIVLYRTSRVAALDAAELAASVVTGLFILGLFVTGALLSIDKPMPAIVSRLHHISPYLAMLSTAVTLYLLLSRR